MPSLRLVERWKEVKTLMPSASWYERNKEKSLAAHKIWRENNREYDLERKRAWYYKEGRKRDLKKMYGLTPEQYQGILEAQNFSCAICGNTEGLCVDHNHSTGVVRGLLCYDCNRNFIGDYEKPDKFYKAASYLEYGWQDGVRKKV